MFIVYNALLHVHKAYVHNFVNLQYFCALLYP